MPAIGDTAPDFELRNQDGVPVRLSQYRGQKVVLFAFAQAFTPGCNAQACGFRDRFPQIQSNGAVVLGISPDQPETLRRWKNENGLPYDLLSDPDHRVLDGWHAWGKSLFGLLTLPRTNRSVWALDENGVVIEEALGVGPAESIKRAVAALGGA